MRARASAAQRLKSAALGRKRDNTYEAQCFYRFSMLKIEHLAVVGPMEMGRSDLYGTAGTVRMSLLGGDVGQSDIQNVLV